MKYVIKVIKFIYNLIFLSLIVIVLIGACDNFTRNNNNKETSSENDKEYENKITQSEVDSVKWLLETAKKGTDSEEVRQAQYDLAECYLSGKLGLPEDESLYIKWITKSANNGYEPACYSLGLHYKKTNKSEAIYWLKKGMDLYYAEYKEENEYCAEALHNLGVYYHPSSKSSSTASSSSSSSNSSSSQQNSSSGSSSLSSSQSTYTPEYGTRDVWVNCMSCNGSGNCSACHGQGYCVSTWSDGSYNDTYKCGVCYGSGRCQQCYGQRGHYEKQIYQIR